MIDIWTIIRWIHLLAAITWIGGMIFIVLVVVPVLRANVSSRQDQTLLTGKVGRRYGVISAIAIILLLVTGFLNAEHANADWSDLGATQWGQALLIKLALVGAVIAITIVHSFYFGVRLERLARAAITNQDDYRLSIRRRKMQRAGIVLSAVNLMLNLAIVLFAAALVS